MNSFLQNWYCQMQQAVDEASKRNSEVMFQLSVDRAKLKARVAELETENAELRAERGAARAAISALMEPSMETREEFRTAWREAMTGDTVTWEAFLAQQKPDAVPFGRPSEGE